MSENIIKNIEDINKSIKFIQNTRQKIINDFSYFLSLINDNIRCLPDNISKNSFDKYVDINNNRFDIELNNNDENKKWLPGETLVKFIFSKDKINILMIDRINEFNFTGFNMSKFEHFECNGELKIELLSTWEIVNLTKNLVKYLELITDTLEKAYLVDYTELINFKNILKELN